MDFFKQYDPPTDLKDPVMLFAFAGWADAADSATHALRYLVENAGATKFAEVDPEEFYNFTRVRPHTKFDGDGNRYIEWPANELFLLRGGEGVSDLVVFVGVEPNLKWRTFSESLAAAVKELGVIRVIHTGALLDAVPHTREPRLTSTATSPELRGLLSGIKVRRSRYTGPTGITGVLMDALRRLGVPGVSLWGHAPHYLHVSPNPKVSLKLLSGLERLVNISVDVEPLRSQGSNFDRRVERALADEPELKAYVERLEEQWDSRWRDGPAEGEGADDMPDPGQAVLGIEEFLRQARQGGDAPRSEG
ncbi:MAG: PAC2 family protein [Chloroflexi bacterium]|nr:PAC2 family protein [Chloroflexota bacterium]